MPQTNSKLKKNEMSALKKEPLNRQEWLNQAPTIHPHLLQRAVENPGTARPETILQLQQQYGNRAIAQMIGAAGRTGQPLLDPATPGPSTSPAGQAASSIIQRAFKGRADLVGGEHLTRVSKASSAHWEAKFEQNYKNLAGHGYGFSFATEAQNEQDAQEINQFVDSVNANGNWDDPYQYIKYDDTVEPPKVRYNVHGSIYSTHADHGQLYPLYGHGITRGRGAADVAKILSQRGSLTEDRKAVLGQLYLAQKDGNWNSEVTPASQLSGNDKNRYIKACDEEALTAPEVPLSQYLPGGISQ
jgi:hypothetical protein